MSNNNSNNSINDNDPQSLTISELINNFPFTSQRHNQEKVLSEICNAFNSGCKYIILEAPTGFGKSPVAIAMRNIFKSKFIVEEVVDRLLKERKSLLTSALVADQIVQCPYRSSAKYQS